MINIITDNNTSLTEILRNEYRPASSLIEITRKCNWKCGFCYLGESRNDEMNVTTLFELLKSIKSMGGYDICFTGGEPMLHPNFQDIIHFAKGLGFVCKINTNASTINETNYKSIASMISEFNISLHSKTPEIHDSITCVPGSWKKTVHSIELLKQAGANVNINTVFTKAVTSEIKGIKEFITNVLECEWTPDTKITSTYDGDIGHQQKYQMEDADIKRVLQQTKLYSFEKISTGVCSAARSSCFIDVYGNVYPCMEFVNTNVTPENIKDNSFNMIWKENALFKEIRKISSTDFTKCIRCNYYKKCHKCIANNYMETSTFTFPSDNVCRSEMFYADNNLNWEERSK